MAVADTAPFPFGRTPASLVNQRPGRRPALSLLLADHDPDAAHQLVRHLSEHQIDVAVSSDGADALLRVGTTSPDVVILSASLPVVGGSALVAALRRAYDRPIIVGVGGGDAQEAVTALTAGATACIARPYRIPELITLLRAMEWANAPQGDDRTLTLGSITLDLAAHAVCVRGTRVDLPLREFQPLRFLMVHADRLVTHAEIREHVWGNNAGASNTVAVHIRRLRERLGDDPGRPRLLVSVRGLGYRLTVAPEGGP